MSDLEIQLRGAMDDLADDAPSSDGLLGAVHRRSRTAHRRRVVAGVSAAVALALAGGASLLTLTGQDDAIERLRVATPGPSPDTGSASPRPMRTAGPAPGSPVDVGWLPPGFPEPTVRLLGRSAWGLDTRRDEGLAALQIQVMAVKPAVRTSPGTLSDVDVDGLPGQLYWVPVHDVGAPPYGNTPPEAEGPYAELTFARKPGQWIRIVIQNSAGAVDLGVTKEDLIRIGDSLVDEDRPVPDAIRITTMPTGLAWSTLTNDDYRTSAGFAGWDVKPAAIDQQEQPNGHNGRVRTSLTVSIVPADSIDLYSYLPPRTARPPAGEGPEIPDGTTISKRDGYTYAVTALARDPKLVVVVQAKNSLGIPEADLRAMAGATELGPDAAVKPTR